MKPMLRVPELIEAVRPLVDREVTADVIFSLIGQGRIDPCGCVGRMPLFSLDQLGNVVQALNMISEASHD